MRPPAALCSSRAIVLLGAGALVPALGVWLASTGNPLVYLRHELPPGQVLYIVSKLMGLVSLGLLWLQCLTGLVQCETGPTAVRPRRVIHRRLGLLVLATASLHALLFVAAASLRTGEPALVLMLPWPGQGHYDLHLSFGAVALWLLASGVIAGLALARRPARGWRSLHWVWLPALILICLHGLGIGSEMRSASLFYVYAVMALGLAGAALLRLRGVLTDPPTSPERYQA